MMLDRFISNQSAMDFDYAHYMLTEGRKDRENPPASSPSREAYRKLLAETFNMNRTRILAFKNKTSERTLDAPGLIDDYYLNFLDWGSSNVLAIALGNTVYLWDATDGATFELEKCYPVLAIALGNTVYLWDATDGAISEQWFSY